MEKTESLYFEMHDSRLIGVRSEGTDLRLEFAPLSMRTAEWSDRFPRAEVVVRDVPDAQDVTRRLLAWGLPRRLSGDRVLGPSGETLDPLWQHGAPPTPISCVEVQPDGPEELVLIHGSALQVFPGPINERVRSPR
jgi:hypothetical protein